MAFHLSVGATDAVGVSPSENVGAATVPATGGLFKIGTGTQACTQYQATSDGISPGGIAADAGGIATAHPFCKRLLYNQGTQQAVASPTDQHYPLNAPGDAWRFDAVITSYVGNYYYSACNPWCTSPGAAGAVATVLKLANFWNTGPSDLPEPGFGYCNKETTPGTALGCWQEYGVNLAVANPVMLAQDTARGAGVTVAAGNGWQLAPTDQTIVGFLTNNGAIVGQSLLNSKVDGYIAAGTLSATARPIDVATGLQRDAAVCGFTPEADTEELVSDLRNFCEIIFLFRGDPSTTPGGMPPNPVDYKNPCSSRVYFCGTLAGGAWYAADVCDNAYVHDNALDICAPGEYDSTVDYDVWHFVVAPSPSACRSLAEPGFVTTASGAAQPYIAHDLDVLAPLGSSLATTGLDPALGFAGHYDEQVDRAVGVDWTVFSSQFITSTGASTPGAVGLGATQGVAFNTPFNGATGDAGDNPVGEGPIRKDSRLEPNAPGDNSRTLSAARTAADACAPHANAGLRRGAEAPSDSSGATYRVETSFDPWVNYIDARPVRGVYFFETSAGIGATTNVGTEYDLYANTNTGQDASSRPVNGQFWIEGNVGMFADADDDFVRTDAADEYEPVVEAFRTRPSSEADNRFVIDPFWIATQGAYPMFWDVYFNNVEIPILPPNAKAPHCRPTWATGTAFISDEMAAAGYDKARTGLVSAVYSREPVVALLGSNYIGVGAAPPVVYTGPVLVVFMSQSLHNMRLFGSAADKAFVLGLVDDARIKAGAPASVSIVYPRDSLSQLTNPNDPDWANGQNWRVSQSDYFGTCVSETGWFRTRWLLTHICGAGAAASAACAGDRIVTAYTFRLTAPLGSANIPAPPISLATGIQHTWWDVDRFDNT